MKYKIIGFLLFVIIGWIVYGFITHKSQTPEEYELQVQKIQNAEVMEILPRYSQVIENLGKDWFVVDITCDKFYARKYLCKVWRNPAGSIISMTFSELGVDKVDLANIRK